MLGDGMVTLVIAGAGASYDCGWPESDAGREILRPPLTNQLLEADTFQLGGLDYLFIELERRRKLHGKDFSLEDSIFEIYNSVALSGQWKGQFLAFRRAIGMFFDRFEEPSRRFSSNYTKLISSYSVRRRDGDILIFLNLNYDCLAEYALNGRQAFRTFSAYLATDDRPISLLHPHGTTRWYEPSRMLPPVRPEPADGGVEKLANSSDLIAYGQRGDVWQNPEKIELSPAISIPMREDFQSKTKWPQSQHDEFERFVGKVTRVLSIGWAAKDMHILQLLADHVALNVPVHVVSSNDAGEIVDRFRKVEFTNVTSESGGFSRFCEGDGNQSSGLDSFFGHEPISHPVRQFDLHDRLLVDSQKLRPQLMRQERSGK